MNREYLALSALVMMFWIILVLVILLCTAHAAPVEVTVDQAGFRVTGTITLREPVSDQVLGVYRFVSGGMGRGSTPLGTYQVGEFLDDDHGMRWQIHAPGNADGEVWDERLHDMRTEIQLHRIATDDGTLGCIGIVADRAAWSQFVTRLQFILAWVPELSFTVEADARTALGSPEKPVGEFKHKMRSAGYAKRLAHQRPSNRLAGHHREKTRTAIRHHRSRYAAKGGRHGA